MIYSATAISGRMISFGRVLVAVENTAAQAINSDKKQGKKVVLS